MHSFNAHNVQKPTGDRQIGFQSRTQFQCCYKTSTCASMAASPTLGDVKSLNKLVRQIKSQPAKLQYWPLIGPLKILRFPDGSYRNNDDGSSQTGMTVFLAESRERSLRDGMAYGSLIDCDVRRSRRQCFPPPWQSFFLQLRRTI